MVNTNNGLTVMIKFAITALVDDGYNILSIAIQLFISVMIC